MKMKSKTKISKIHSYLVHPGKHLDDQPAIRGTEVASKGKLLAMLNEIYRKADKECDIEIVFVPNNGKQQNACRDSIIEYLRNPTLDAGKQVALRLQKVTTNRSGLGLLFLIRGSDTHNYRLVISRFPADRGILAHEGQKKLTIEFIERIFLKSATAYKSALYIGRSFATDFWDGRAIDRQINSDLELSKYWINEFLLSDFLTTSAAGTRRLAIALRQAIDVTKELGVKEELLAAARLLRGKSGQVTSAADITRAYDLSGKAARLLMDSFAREELYEENFKMDIDELNRYIPFRSIELDNGAMLVGEDAQFDKIFKKEMILDSHKKVRYMTEGRIINQRLKKTR